jgi:hypothetical protein
LAFRVANYGLKIMKISVLHRAHCSFTGGFGIANDLAFNLKKSVLNFQLPNIFTKGCALEFQVSEIGVVAIKSLF